MNYIIIEDEKHNRLMLEAQVAMLRPDWQCQHYFDKVSTAVDYLKNNPDPELIFMDIQLKDDNCFAIFEQCIVNAPIIFTTAYDEFAIKAFEVNSIDYLLKPIDEQKLSLSLDKFDRLHLKETPVPQDYDALVQMIQTEKNNYKQRFLISGIDSYFKVNTSDIAYFISESGVTHVVLYNGKKYTLDQTLEKLEQQVDPTLFFRANRHIILHIDAVVKFENYFGGKLSVFLHPKPSEETITISRLKATAFKAWMDQ
ncbi:LytTR family DNA-binding domain-containing protein [Persicobacter sp. CCB-QB2]|uniref:LytR/AlgR family response regulator transcription factor n=1 Tax=Persicobacter sp. CCB-QB2 TaxID=1561025 RepID=UPI0006A963AE|nr:LytTR family DNA-binding domain-containing protein [Persicobacter sp. CCB-QB2]